jgi:hypothetical protein
MAAPKWISTAVAALALVLPGAFLIPTSPALAEAPECTSEHCGLLADGAYGNLVIGRLVQVGTDAQMRRLYAWAKAHGYWKSLPSTPEPYLQDVKLISIALPPSLAEQPVTVFMQADEYAVAPLPVGALVRYSPHGAKHAAPANADADGLALYHGLTGCVAVLCGPHDSACANNFWQGVFTKAKGEPVNPHTGAPIVGGEAIDPVSLLPRPTKKTAKSH